MIAIATILLVALADAGTAASAMTATGTLDDSLMPRRTVLVFVPVDALATDTPEIDALRAIILANGCAIEDRDLDIFIDGIDAIDGLGPGASSLAGGSPDDLRSVYAVDERRFEMVLIGKDGGIKARGEKPEDLIGFLALIDTMPMRRAEIAERGRGCASKRKTRPKRPVRRLHPEDLDHGDG
ncbi:DUF4174 domain-containing protein [Thioalkalivibrio sp. HK1]|uniref:DUF4174 domain-containing protein n=1 Tax=Thioalkalivibrio sp. HK1 TaxID=1469245 RepID=UPI0012DBEB3F|nr:DUF4174 domain-containing protein [Thioalkalivibrio sp. HK1]